MLKNLFVNRKGEVDKTLIAAIVVMVLLILVVLGLMYAYAPGFIQKIKDYTAVTT